MVNAILAGTKFQTRRTIKPKPDLILNQAPFLKNIDSPNALTQIDCPYGKPGDVLWVKESWSHNAYPQPVANATEFFYKADDTNANLPIHQKWITPLFMPLIAILISLEITEIRAERLNDCSIEDAIAEGVIAETSGDNALAEYRSLWESINGAGSWAANPWVWVVEFRRL
jgi:hypothetical protein